MLCTQLQETASHLEKLGLSNIRLTSASGPILARAVRGSWTLTHLDLNDNSLNDAGLSPLCRVLEDHRCRIESLKLESNDLTQGCCDDLASALAQNQTLKELNLSFNPLEDVGVEKLLKKMGSRSCKLHTLRLSSTTLTERSGMALGAALRDNPALRNLDLSSNELKDEGARLIFQALEETHSQIEKLWLQDISLTHVSCEALGSFLRSSKDLTTLHLKENPIGDQGLSLLSAGLGRSACQLQTLRLDTAALGDVGVQDLIRVLVGRRSITELTLPYNSISDASINALSHLVKTSPSLKEIRLRRNKFSPEGCHQLKRLARAGLILSVGD
ncbi:ribonuclease inhibitor-like [Carcharodon carcharias]|uniref:ribonuclease inhibitor-like n=1 Tax=Carcharodon carcharias TaxID=13397 RepID=UPI001B7E6704|nr:ribonuclease inhibitor-like [Carcharodon carcharias]